MDFEGKVYESMAIIMTMVYALNNAVYDVKFRSRSIISLCTCMCNPARGAKYQ